jgi:hypothetical protein
LKLSAVLQICDPEPFTVNVSLANVAPPANPTAPISLSDHIDVATVSVIVTELLNPSPVPVTVTDVVPVVTALLAARVNVLDDVAGLVPKDALTPLGRPDTDSTMLPLKPFSGITVIVLDALAPCEIFKLFGEAERVKLGTAPIVKVILVSFERFAEVPVIVTTTVPAAVKLLAVNVIVLDEVAGFTLNEADTPLGKPDAYSVTLFAKPFRAVTVIVLVLLIPAIRLKLLGEAESVKFGAPAMVIDRVVLLVRLPEVPVIVVKKVPAVAVLAAVRVKMLEDVAGFALNEAVTPLGKPAKDKVTPPVKPFCPVTVMALEPLAP